MIMRALGRMDSTFDRMYVSMQYTLPSDTLTFVDMV